MRACLGVLPSSPWHCVLLLAAIGLGAAAPAQSYTIRRLTAPGLGRGTAYDIDNSMRIVGELRDSSGLPQPVMWVNGTAQLLARLPGGSQGSATCLDISGRIGGRSGTAITSDSGAFWDPGLGLAVFEFGVPPGFLFGGVTGINWAGSACGFADNGIDLVPVVRTSDSEIVHPELLPTLPMLRQGEALDITDSDLVVGYLAQVDPQPIFWSKVAGSWTTTQLPTLGPVWGVVTTAIDDQRFVGAAVAPGSGRIHFVRWTNGVIADLGGLPGTDCYATAGSLFGETAGWARTFSTPPYLAVHRPANGPVVDLNSKLPPQSNWLLTAVEGMNDSGAMVGTGVQNGLLEPFVMIPTRVVLANPTPGTVGVLNTFSVTGASSGADVWFCVSLSGGETVIPGCLEGLDIGAPLVLGNAAANASGAASLNLFVPPFVAGLPFLFQAYDLSQCWTSNVVAKTF
ncbi:MAG: hypothetical protein MUC36_08175 [Planctomycetes bacterium]|nr:hypothetical protein [Planctomycetota bacterium]